VNSTDFFLSHSSQDKPFVRRLDQFLTRLGFKVWLDVRAIVPGDQVTLEIAKGLLRAKVIIVVVSEASLKSKWLSYEINSVMPKVVGKKCRLIPVLIQNVKVPAELRSFLYADFRQSFRKGCSQLRKALKPYEKRKSAKFYDFLPSLSERETFLRTAINSVFDRSKLKTFPSVGNYFALDFSGRANEEDQQYSDEIYLCYEGAKTKPDFLEFFMHQEISGARPDLNDNYMFALRNRIAGEGGSYYHLLVADRPVSAWTKAAARTGGRVRVQKTIYKKEEPAVILISVDVTGVNSKDQIISYLTAAREVYRNDGERWMSYANC
jgi:hypothetical protein